MVFYHNVLLKISHYSQAERERKRQEQLDKKQEAKLLLAEEEEQVGGKTSKGASAATKVTRAQISEAEEKRKRESEASSASALPKRVSIDEPALELNPNLEAQQRRMAGELEARTVDEAIAVLSVGKETTQERHPERRVKAAYAAYEERELPRLKEENPNLRLSQLKQLLRKEWMKSPENPMNQHHLAYNSKT